MWEGKMTEELTELFIAYSKEHYGAEPDSYVELCYDAMTYDEFVGYIKEALQKHCCIVDLVE